MKPIVLYGHHAGPNPRKVAMVLEELGVPYIHKLMDFTELKKPAYEAINPNGRVPAIQDPNTEITLWESGAIIEYLVGTYDKERIISFTPGSSDYYHAKQWLYFQVSGQGPYFGQAVWFKVHHQERVISALDRYMREIRRVLAVLNRSLDGREYLVNGTFSYVDISFVTWLEIIPWVSDGSISLEIDYPAVFAWLNRVSGHDGVKKVLNMEVKLPQRK
ncbi:glutathione S-transferase Ure2-like protein [Penicillium maclennaniae]|uniref:glutathione S-transferase Ure2-like protein n=1 Tax=Penicillium maclennaniae TaxID=1343394 RepID=UPI00254223B8|nr:glutathione S-transferase Ure2-like protein [Penicillium maclennaniae]KAJ5674764.1 glutathione S-transferase Ure2-like protein [Penicillium maclennaniae]